MGEVYKARDTRLDRTVAIKVLPSHLADKPQLRERFEREARTVASLNHPHICVLHDIGQQDGIHFLVMEYLEGETLAQRLDKGPLPLDQVLRYAIEIADALDKAHRQGVTHRDLKPGNIMLTKVGAKLLDFGLAKLRADAAPGVPFSQLPTAQDSLTVEGTILGTLQYMAPEQVEGKVDDVDARTDIFAFGAVVYEMATGKKAFEGKSAASVIGKIMQYDPPPMSSLQPMTPPTLDRVVKKCMAKVPEKRWQAASDLYDELKWIAEGGSETGMPAVAVTVAASPGWRRALPLVLTAVVAVILGGIAVWILMRSGVLPPQPVSRFALTLPLTELLGARTSGMFEPVVALSPDGTRLVYVANQQLYLRLMDSLEARPIPGTEGAAAPFFSPDGQWVGFFADGKLKKVSISGGAALTLCDAPNSRGASWGPDDTIVFAPTPNSGLFQVSAAGGTPQVLTTLKAGDVAHDYPHSLPGGKAVLFRVWGSTSLATSRIEVHVLGTGERRVLVQGGTHVRYVPTGHLVYAQAGTPGTLLAVPFDLERLEVTGNPFPIVESVFQSSNNGLAQFSFSHSGSLVYVPGGLQAAAFSLVWVDRQGAVEPLGAPPHTYRNIRLSPDGRQVASTIADASIDVWVYDISRGTLTRLTFEGRNGHPIWTPDGMRLTFRSNREGGPLNLFWKPADGSGAAERLTTSEQDQSPTSWSPDGQVLAFYERSFAEGQASTDRNIWVVPLEGEREPRPFLQTPFNEGGAVISPDGRWLAYVSNESGRFDVYVQPFPGPGGKRQISTEGGNEPVWSRNGEELFYRNGNQMMAVEITTEPTFSAGTPSILFEGAFRRGSVLRADYDIAPDGQRFVMLQQGGTDALTQINVVLNWFEELMQRVPTGN